MEGAVVEAALEAMRDGGPRLESFGYSSEDAFAVGLTCGGELEVHIQPLGSAPGTLRLLKAFRHSPATGRASALALIRRVDAHGGGAVVIPDPASVPWSNPWKRPPNSRPVGLALLKPRRPGG